MRDNFLVLFKAVGQTTLGQGEWNRLAMTDSKILNAA